MPCCLIALGSNLGDRHQSLDRAVAALVAHPDVRVIGHSVWHPTQSVGGPTDQPAFLNGAAVIETPLDPHATLDILQRIERELGRRPGPRWGPRPIDLDLLLCDQTIVQTPRLVLPHPRMAWRRFVLVPAAEVAGSMVHPTTGWTIARLLDHLNHTTPYLAITGAIGAGKTHLAQRLTREASARLVAEPLDLGKLEAFYADPSSLGWELELEFLRRRAGLLAAHSPEWSSGRLTVSDFWFDQSLAFARVWLPPERWEAFHRRWEQSRSAVVRPRLLVLLDAPAERLLARVVRRARRGEQRLGLEQLQRIRQSILLQVSQPDQGPVLRLDSDDFDGVFAEVSAAADAML